ncbi:MAG: 2-amino-4-hydroxy-6-hydroxymethyldihydropteridine diphosphokinase [Magnetococcales bacterium]|nr:2-amino-4-hydroxy-6-hydroxymethyldihydropteridine diphosphokinase [Magnetococcales bacterium]NGZ25698.1 2-amino-4-hydroxy-6-hydroxymethyldihydropteridine diphosphokinase [Magnetococcales bacterium]
MKFPPWHSAYLALGGNQGEEIAHFTLALRRLRRTSGIRLLAISPLYASEPVGYTEQPWFVNGACHLLTCLTPLQLLKITQRLERLSGRKRLLTNGPRTLDLDVLLWDNRIISQKKIVIPHPRMNQRRFVLQPLCDIKKGIYHPKLGKTVDSLLQEVDHSSQMVRLKAASSWWTGDRYAPTG